MAVTVLVVGGWDCRERSAADDRTERATVKSGAAERLPVVAETRGPADPHEFDLSLLVPRGARLRQIWVLHGGRRPDDMLIEWVRSTTVSLYGEAFRDTVRWGLTLWTQTPRSRGYQAPWKGFAVPLLTLAPGAPGLRVAVADVTSDGHPDVLVEQYPHTNHGCGPHQAVARLARGTWQLFRASLCETTLRGVEGLLALDLPLYEPGDSVCCPSKVEKRRLRWNGHRYVIASSRIVAISRR